MKNSGVKKHFWICIKIISVILSFVMLGTVIPSIPVFAEETNPGISSTVVPDTKNESEKEPEIICELSEKRALSEKYFLMDDGSITVAQYGQPVHFVDSEGKMKDIDNSLVEITDAEANKILYRKETGDGSVS